MRNPERDAEPIGCPPYLGHRPGAEHELDRINGPVRLRWGAVGVPDRLGDQFHAAVPKARW